MSVLFQAYVFAAEDEPFSWRDVRDGLSRQFPSATVTMEASRYGDGLLVVLEDGYQIAIDAERDVPEFVGHYLQERGSAATLSDGVAGRLRRALATCTLRIDVGGDNDMDRSDDHFNDWVIATEVVEAAVRGAITVDAAELD